ncbi:MAG: diphosphomevalonate decarboxylase [Chloroflexota bacterium]
MPTMTATAQAFSNLAFIKYWGNIDETLRLAASGSISMNLGGLFTRTTVTFQPDLTADSVTVDGQVMSGSGLERVSHHLDYVRKLAGVQSRAIVESANNFPTGAGIASSASAFAALSLAATAALGLHLSELELSSLARLGSGSASRSVPGGFVEWIAGSTHETSFAQTFAPADYWALTDLVAIVSRAHKRTGSTEGHALAGTSVLQTARLQSAPERLARCKDALLRRDFAALAEVVELDSNIMHAVMMTSIPPLFYWQPETLAVMEAVREWRSEGIEVFYTIDAGPNVHCLCAPGHEQAVHERLTAQAGVIDILKATPGGPARVEPSVMQN